MSNPSCFLLGLPGLGKSTLARRIATGLTDTGTLPMVFGDLKPDYVDLIRALGGQVISLNRQTSSINILDRTEAKEAINQLREAGYRREADEIAASSAERCLNILLALITISRKEPPTDREEALLSRALDLLDEHHTATPTMPDLLALIRQAPTPLRETALDRGDMARYLELTENLEVTLSALIEGGRLGTTFSGVSTVHMRRDTPVVFDVSSFTDANQDLQAAALLACWATGFGTIEVANTLADVGLAPRRHYFIIIDELWRALRVAPGMVERVDSLTRLNRNEGVGQLMITHTMSDLEALPSEEERAKARGFVERAGMVIAGGLSPEEMPKLCRVVKLSAAEQRMITSWKSPPGWDSRRASQGNPPGQGNFLLKVGGTPGIPFHVDLAPSEYAVNDTQKRWTTTDQRMTERSWS